MTIEIPFTKASGAGNDFVIIDNRDSRLPENKSVLAQRLCSRSFGIGADGLLILENSSTAQFSMMYYNADGSYGGMCGNGGRCLARYAFLRGIAPPVMTFQSLDFQYKAEVKDATVVLTLKDPTPIKTSTKLPQDEWSCQMYFVDTGSPHVVSFVDNVDVVPVEDLGRAIRHAAGHMPAGTNVNFAQIMSENSIRIRTYERGVEAETLACGTGAVASAVVAHLMKGLRLPLIVRVRSGELLIVDAQIHEGRLVSPTLEGSAHILFSGNLLYDTISHSITESHAKEPENS